MSVTPGYGETPLDFDELDALHPEIRKVLGDPVTKAEVYDLEQAIQGEVAAKLVSAAVDGSLAPADLLDDHFLRELHGRLYGEIWVWAGVFRKRELNLGVAPEKISVDLRASLDNIRYRWAQGHWSARELGIVAHTEVVRIHPFVDGNGRTSRLLADLVFVAAQGSDPIELYAWQLDKGRYIGLLREYDAHRNPHDLSVFVETLLL